MRLFTILTLLVIALGCSTISNILPTPTTLPQAKQQIAQLQKQNTACAKQLASYKDGNITTLRHGLTLIAGIAFIAALGLVAAALYAGFVAGFRLAIACGAVAVIAALAAVYIQTILIVSACVLGIAALAWTAYEYAKHRAALAALWLTNGSVVHLNVTPPTVTKP